MTRPGSTPRRGAGPRRPSRALETRTARAAITDALKFHGIADQVRAERVHTEWADLVGPRIAARTRPYGVTDRALIIDVASSAWLQELNLLRAQILTGLLERVGEPRLFDELKFKLAGRTGPRPELRRPKPRAKVEPVVPIPATGAAREKIVREVEAVDDLELRELIARVRIANDR